MADHHDPLADARAAGGIVSAMAAQAGVTTLGDLASRHGVSIGRMSSGLYTGSVCTVSGSGGLTFPGVNPDADPDGYLFGRVVVFTGALMSMTRQLAWEECARVGALAEKTPTKRTNVLVVGDINPAVLRPGTNVTGKARKAFELQDKGQDIEVMTEDDFLRCLDGGEFRKFDLDTAATAAAVDRKTIPVTNAEPPRLPKPLRREGSATEQACSERGCESMAAFKTRSKPTWCTHHIDEILRVGGLTPLESFTRPDDWRLTECRTCGCVAHYRFVYTLAKNAEGEHTCRACYWREWARSTRALQGAYANVDPVPYEKAQALAEEHGYIYLGPLTQPSLPDDPHRTQCRRCGKISAERLGDISFGCTCATR
jgi:DNA polymerase-3 subunit epsilon